MAKIDSQLVGAMGETIVLYELMYRGWIPANVNAFVKNARNIDVIAIKGKRQVAISVKTSGPNSGTNFQLGGEPDSKVFNRHIGAEANFICFVILPKEGCKDSRSYQVFVVPVSEAEVKVQESDRHWRSLPKTNRPR